MVVTVVMVDDSGSDHSNGHSGEIMMMLVIAVMIRWVVINTVVLVTVMVVMVV